MKGTLRRGSTEEKYIPPNEGSPSQKARRCAGSRAWSSQALLFKASFVVKTMQRLEKEDKPEKHRMNFSGS